MTQEYEIELWDPFSDSTSTSPYPSGKPMPTEAEGLGMAAEKTMQMFNPVETAVGIGDMLSGIANDGVRLVGGTPEKRAPSFVGGIKDLGKSFADDPLLASFEVATAPGSIPGFFTGALVPKIPKGTGYNLLRDRPGFKKVRNYLKDVDRYDYTLPGPDRKLTERRRSGTELDDFIEQARTAMETKKSEIAPTKLKRISDSPELKSAMGMHFPSENAVVYPRRRLTPAQEEALRKNYPEYTPALRRFAERHEDAHAIVNSGQNLGGGSAFNWYDEANANVVGKKSISGGLKKWAKGIRAKNIDGDYIYNNHGGGVGRGLATGAAKMAEMARDPFSPLIKTAAPIQNREEYEVE